MTARYERSATQDLVVRADETDGSVIVGALCVYQKPYRFDKVTEFATLSWNN